MICPHCNKTIHEQKRYLMSRDHDGELVWTPSLRAAAMYVLLFLFVVSLLTLVSHVVPT